MEPGDIVEFFEDKRIFLGVVLELKGERLPVLTQTSREMTLTPKRVLHVGPRLSVATLSRQELLRHLEATARQREGLKDAINLEDLWELLASEDQTVSVAEMADLWFGPDDPRPGGCHRPQPQGGPVSLQAERRPGQPEPPGRGGTTERAAFPGAGAPAGVR